MAGGLPLSLEPLRLVHRDVLVHQFIYLLVHVLAQLSPDPPTVAPDQEYHKYDDYQSHIEQVSPRGLGLDHIKGAACWFLGEAVADHLKDL